MDTGLLVDVSDMRFRGALGNGQGAADMGNGAAFLDVTNNFPFSGREHGDNEDGGRGRWRQDAG